MTSLGGGFTPFFVKLLLKQKSLPKGKLFVN